MKIQKNVRKDNWTRQIFNGSTALIVAAGITVGVSFMPNWVSAQETATEVESSSLLFTSPLDDGENQDAYPAPQRESDRRGNDDTRQTFLAEALGIAVEELVAAQDAARQSVDGRDDFQSEFAEALGLTEEALSAAREEARDAAIAEAIADGRITEEEVAEREVARELRTAERELNEAIERNELFAEVLDMSLDAFEAALADGVSVRDLAEQQGLDNDTLREGLNLAYAGAVQDAVADGVVTQEQADAILADDNNDGRNGNQGQRNNRGNRDDQNDQGNGQGNNRGNNRGNDDSQESSSEDQTNNSDSPVVDTEDEDGSNEASQNADNDENAATEDGIVTVNALGDTDANDGLAESNVNQSEGRPERENRQNRRRNNDDGNENNSDNATEENDGAVESASTDTGESTAEPQEENNNRRGNRENDRENNGENNGENRGRRNRGG